MSRHASSSRVSSPGGVAFLLLLAAGTMAAACGPGDGTVAAEAVDPSQASLSPARAATADIVPVIVTRAESGPMTSWILTSGNLEAVERVDVLAKVPGQIESLHAEEGTRVVAGDLLAELDPNEYRLAAARAEAELNKKRADLVRYRRMLSEGVLSQADFEQASYDLQQAQLALEQARIDLEGARVRAPIDGVVSARLVHRGERVTAHQHLFTIVDPTRLWVHVFVPESDLPGLAVGQEATISAAAIPGGRLRARVSRIAPVVDPETGTAKVTVRPQEPAGLRPGMFVDVRIVTSRLEKALLLPKRAIVYGDQTTSVFKLAERDGRTVAVAVPVRLGASDGERVQILEGLQPGDRVVLVGHDALRSGSPVRVVDGGDAGLADLTE